MKKPKLETTSSPPPSSSSPSSSGASQEAAKGKQKEKKKEAGDDQKGFEEYLRRTAQAANPLYRPTNKYYNAVTILQAAGIRNPYLAPAEVLRGFDAQFFDPKVTPEDQRRILKQYVARFRLYQKEVSDLSNPAASTALLAMAANMPVRNLSSVTGRLEEVPKLVYRTQFQQVRDEASRAGIQTARGHGLLREPPILAYVNQNGKVVYLSKQDRVRCMEGKLPNAPTCPNPPYGNNLSGKGPRMDSIPKKR